MTVPSQETTVKPDNKELNFRMLEAKFQKQLEEERAARIKAEQKANELMQSKPSQEDEDEDADPYVDNKKLNKKLARHGEMVQKQTQSEIEKAIKQAIKEDRKERWLKENSDFFDVMKHAEKIAITDPDLADSILEMPDSFERQKLVYKNVKALGLHKDPQKEPTIQDKIDANRRSPFYQSSGMSSSPYTQTSDFSDQGKKNAYEKMQELKSRLRLG